MAQIKIVMGTSPLIRNFQSGDWHYENDKITALVLENKFRPESELAILIHELIEAFLCRKQGITDIQVCQFDEQFESERITGKHPEDAEPGDDSRSPYRDAHQRATHVERAVCHALDLNWNAHEKEVQS